MPSQTTLVSGTEILRRVRDDLAPYRARIESHQRQVTIIRFDAASTDPSQWRWRMEASRISAEQKVKAFGHVGFAIEHLALAAETSRAEFASLVQAR